ncbi:MAG: hypothetical protein F4X66_17030 [Chloroflexi bacterium]|nr:hypothetical protein [Chloroflexota bacterium]MYE41609.1 hypothetical protein [Chloroflexota bacterium]
MPVAEMLKMNCPTLGLCRDSRQVPRRMRQGLLDFRDAGIGSGESDVSDSGLGAAGACPVGARIDLFQLQRVVFYFPVL